MLRRWHIIRGRVAYCLTSQQLFLLVCPPLPFVFALPGPLILPLLAVLCSGSSLFSDLMSLCALDSSPKRL